MVYLDYAATTPIDPEVLEAMREVEGVFGNPNSVHGFGQEARRVLEGARERVAGLLGVRPREVVFTASGSEADALAVLGVALARGKGHVVSTAVEHAALLGALRLLERLGFAVTYLKPDPLGMVYPEQVVEALRPDTFLVSVMAANNELGNLYPVRAMAEVAHAHGALFHTDAVQAIGQVPFRVDEVGADLVSLSAHKFYGPKGIGALLVRHGVELFPLVPGKQEGGEAGRDAKPPPGPRPGGGPGEGLEAPSRGEPKAPRLEEAPRGRASFRGGRGAERPPQGAPAQAGERHGEGGGWGGVAPRHGPSWGVAVSSGSACSAGSLEPSHVSWPQAAPGRRPGPPCASPWGASPPWRRWTGP
jgi:cysteine desulfurase